MSEYNDNFYAERNQKTSYSANAVLTKALKILPEINSAVDFGCGVGTWLASIKKMGALKVQGCDGAWVNKELLVISTNEFQSVDFECEINLGVKYDLAISLEVAEHISAQKAEQFVNSLVMAADYILFSAAIPLQGGTGHINEQWPEYWAEMFMSKGYTPLDCIRWEIWNDNKIPYWYRQNIVLFVRNEKISCLKCGVNMLNPGVPISVVHPEMMNSKLRRIKTVRGCWSLLKKSIKEHLKRRILKLTAF